ncbi:alpha/beta fold hydrolase [Hoyosella sp. YIM 151337]|uniref:alpha/beta fold hydrolase n=1 Tax=Hoyosella sp. YIM 151337 TaxID=2992742 RepID=UPI0022362EB1|nr:alpha/beta fold hydrolase [Hoyosella sp. YIM 151337]MCW4355535.1 alpha/beta fold hydrolase [Hoyosella sp. YIM 151337]
MNAQRDGRIMDPGRLLESFFPRKLHDVALTHSDAVLRLNITGYGSWGVTISDGSAAVTREAPRKPTSTLTMGANTLEDVLLGRRSGVEAFLEGDLATRGSLATVLQVGGSLAPQAELPTRPKAWEVQASGARTAYLEAGPENAPPVVLLHGLGGTNATMLPALAALAREYRVLAPDIPGFGASEAPLWNYTAARLYRWLDGFLRVTGTRGATVVGNSMGGRLALELAMHDPVAARALVLLCPAPAFRRFRQLVPLVRYLPVSLGAAARLSVPRSLIVRSAKMMVAHPERMPESWFEAAADEFALTMTHWRHRRAALSALANIYIEEAFGADGFWDRLRNVATPALFVWGQDDRLVPAKFARHVEQALPRSESVVLSDCGHAPQLELPGKSMAITRDFLASTAGLSARRCAVC